MYLIGSCLSIKLVCLFLNLYKLSKNINTKNFIQYTTLYAQRYGIINTNFFPQLLPNITNKMSANIATIMINKTVGLNLLKLSAFINKHKMVVYTTVNITNLQNSSLMPIKSINNTIPIYKTGVTVMIRIKYW